MTRFPGSTPSGCKATSPAGSAAIRPPSRPTAPRNGPAIRRRNRKRNWKSGDRSEHIHRSSVLDRRLALRMAELLLVQLQEQIEQRREARWDAGAPPPGHGRPAWAADQERAAVRGAFHF